MFHCLSAAVPRVGQVSKIVQKTVSKFGFLIKTWMESPNQSSGGARSHLYTLSSLSAVVGFRRYLGFGATAIVSDYLQSCR